MSDANTLYVEAERLRLDGRVREALELFRAAGALVLTTNVACRLAACLVELGELDEALTWFRMAQTHKPQAQVVLETSLLLAGALLAVGRYPEGWPLMAARAVLRPDVVPPVQVPFPEWTGEPLAGRSLLIWVEQGFGDQIMFARFARRLMAQGARVTAACRPPLAALFEEIDGLKVISAAAGASVAVPNHDYWTRYFSLPLHLGTTADTIPGQPYLQAPADRLHRWKGYAGAARIGVMWRTSPTGTNAGGKSLPDAQAQRLLDFGGVSLQPEHTGVADFADTAAIISQLDLVISVDTSVAHLAGAMGAPCWTLLPDRHLDWRWMNGRPDNPWYPQMRLFRQAPGSDWSPVVSEVIAALG